MFFSSAPSALTPSFLKSFAIAGSLAAAMLMGPASAQQQAEPLMPLEKVVQEGAALSDVSLRCAGLFHSVWDFGSEVRLDADAIAQAKANVALFLDAGVTLRHNETGGDTDAIGKAAVAEAFAISSRYYKHYEANVAAEKEPYATDELWTADFEVCRNLAAQF